MSDTVHYTGKLKLLATGELNAIAYANKILADNDVPEGYVNKLEMLLDDSKYEFSGENLYQVLEKTITEGDVFHMEKTTFGNIFNFTFQYYNGGCSFNEALRIAEKDIKL